VEALGALADFERPGRAGVHQIGAGVRVLAAGGLVLIHVHVEDEDIALVDVVGRECDLQQPAILRHAGRKHVHYILPVLMFGRDGLVIIADDPVVVDQRELLGEVRIRAEFALDRIRDTVTVAVLRQTWRGCQRSGHQCERDCAAGEALHR